jgi:hypothetical protein
MPGCYLCQDRTCPARGQCLRFLARPSPQQLYYDFQAARALTGGVCSGFMEVQRGDDVRSREAADQSALIAESARVVNPTEKEKV